VGEFVEFETNREEFARELGRVGKKMADLRVPFGLIARSQFKFERTIFKLKSRGKYKELNPEYAKEKKRAVGFEYPILFRTGKLARALLQPGGYNILRITKKTLDMGVKTGERGIVYAAIHQFGSKKGMKPKISARPYLFIDDQRKKAWINILRAHAKKVFKT
jgi:phage gpG-like protein